MSADDLDANEEARSMPAAEIRMRIVRRAFGGDEARFETFLAAIRRAIPVPVTVVLRGSAVTGVKWADGSPFDGDGPGTSDLDLTLVGSDMLKLFDEMYIPGLHSAPLCDDRPEAAPALVPLRRALSAIAGRPVNIQATTSLVQYARDILLDQPCFTLIDDGGAEGAASPQAEPE